VERDAFGGRELGTGAAAIDHDEDHDRVGAEVSDDLGRFERRRAARRGVFGDDDLVAGEKRPSDAAHHPVILRVFADAERAEPATAGGTDRSDAERNRVGSLREPADRRRFGRDDLERRVGDEHHAVGPAHRLLRVDEPRAVLPGLEDEVASADGMGTQMLDERIIRHDLQTTAVILRVFTEPQQGASYDDLLAVALRAEELAFDAFFRSDHYLKMGNVSGLPGPSDSWVTLAGLARDTSRIRLGTMVTSATFRLPGPLAISVAQVDAMSGGRVELGLGAGWYEAEHKAYAIPFPSLGERFERLEEQLAIITGLWTTPEGETFAFEGKHHSVSDSPGLPKPVQQPRPPIIVGGNGPKRTPRLAATYADEYNVAFSPVSKFTEQTDRVKAACDAVGRDPSTMTWSACLVLCCGRDEAEVTRRAEAIGRAPDELRKNGAAGTPGEVVETLRKFQAAGAERMYLQVLDLSDLDHLSLIAAEVAPHLG
jgi:F420-dependent oxidoreductase-like protein